MINEVTRRTNWKWCALAAAPMVLLSLIPQIHLWAVRGAEWNGAYTSLQGDEFLYSAYTNALMEGRPRRYDPFTGLDKNLNSGVKSESTFSIQFLSGYAMATLARLTGMSASSAFIVLIAASALFASIAIFWLFISLGVAGKLASVGSLAVLVLGGPAGGQGFLGLVLKTGLLIPGFPFLRRYQPAAVFPLFFVLIFLVWKAFTAQNRRESRIYGLAASFVMGILVFGYLYLWTAAAAWLSCIAVLWLFFRASNRGQAVFVLATITAITGLTLIPYFYLVSNRTTTLDEQQTLVISHFPDLLRIPEVLGLAILVALMLAARWNKIQWNNPSVLFCASLALLPFVVFNQQVITGRSMQPYHYEAFVVNYTTLVALVVAVSLLWKAVPTRALVWIAAIAFSWGMFEVGLPAKLTSVPNAVMNDRMIPVFKLLRELASHDGSHDPVLAARQASPLVFSPYVAVNVLLPSWTTQGTVLDIGGLDLGTVSKEEREEYLYVHLYFSGVDGPALREPLNGRSQDVAMNYYGRSAIFGHERMLPGMSVHFDPIQQHEIEAEVSKYESYVRRFSREDALKRPFRYAVILADGKFDFSNLDKWYERDSGQQVGDYILYKVRLRQ